MSPDIPQTWIPAIHAGMTKICVFMFCGRAKDHESVHGEFDFIWLPLSRCASVVDTFSQKTGVTKRISDTSQKI